MGQARRKTLPPQPTTLEILGSRLQKIINSPTAQKSKCAVLYKAPSELDEDWNQILEAIFETDGVSIAHMDDGGVQVSWEVPDGF